MRVFCSTNACTLQRAQLGHAQRMIATLRWERDALTAQVATLAAQLADVRRDLDAERAQRAAAWAEVERLRAELDEMAAALAEAQASTEFYLDLFCAERARQGAGVRRP